MDTNSLCSFSLITILKIRTGLKFSEFTRAIRVFIVLFIFLSPELRAQNLDVPFVPTSETLVELMLEMGDVKPGDYVIDLGSGDGRIVIAAAKRGAIGHGIDIDPKRIEEANQNALKQGVEKKVLFIENDLFKADFSRASVITMYLLNSVNLKLLPHLLEKLRPGTRIVSHDFDMGEWKPDKHIEEGYSDVYFWVIPADASGTWKWDAQGREFAMDIKQQFQEVEINLKSENTVYKIEDKVLSGERISFTAMHPSNENTYIFSGRIEGESIKGMVQLRTKTKAVISDWDAVRTGASR